MVESSGDSKFARNLASCDDQSREKTFSNLSKWLSSRTDLVEVDLLKIWKGLFYSMWHADLQPVQDHLADRMAELLRNLNGKVGELYFVTFLTTMRREWFGIDKLRMDKFMGLVRRFIGQMFVFLERHNWNGELVALFTVALEQRVFLYTGSPPTLGLTLHITDVFFNELKACTSAMPHEETLLCLIEPFIQVAAKHSSPAAMLRVETIFQDALGVDSNGLSLREGFSTIACKEVAEYLQELATSEDSASSRKNRRVLYAIRKIFMAAAKRGDQGAGSKLRARKAAEAGLGDEDGREAEGEKEAAVPTSAKKKKKKAAGPKADLPTSTPASVKKAKKSGEADAQEEECTVVSLEQAFAVAAGEAGEKSKASVKGKKKRKVAATVEAGDVDNATPHQAWPEKAPTSTPRRKRVTFSLKSNLEFYPNVPPHPASTRTPPAAQPHGSALKKHKPDMSAVASASALKKPASDATPKKVKKKKVKMEVDVDVETPKSVKKKKMKTEADGEVESPGLMMVSGAGSTPGKGLKLGKKGKVKTETAQADGDSPRSRAADFF
ncbi:hypothetical protein CYMTET_18599 [Cymbomonas tetramitiformis]|uniref:Uncharacterized protein n=1 Tax=Cymbomonas tetramitiformis TaxID=36881 RepID=A0AAE0G937_9CHLO|nr:hypothetical protein CYMTET_18599 [Cymbomonas tetramitiformis]